MECDVTHYICSQKDDFKTISRRHSFLYLIVKFFYSKLTDIYPQTPKLWRSNEPLNCIAITKIVSTESTWLKWINNGAYFKDGTRTMILMSRIKKSEKQWNCFSGEISWRTWLASRRSYSSNSPDEF